MCIFYEISENDFNYYNYQPGSNIITVYCKHITDPSMHTHAHTRAPTRRRSSCVAVRWVGAPNHDKVNGPFSPGDEWPFGASFKLTVPYATRIRAAVFAIVFGVFRIYKISRSI